MGLGKGNPKTLHPREKGRFNFSYLTDFEKSNGKLGIDANSVREIEAIGCDIFIDSGVQCEASFMGNVN